jgi:hypothetical protein
LNLSNLRGDHIRRLRRGSSGAAGGVSGRAISWAVGNPVKSVKTVSTRAKYFNESVIDDRKADRLFQSDFSRNILCF